MKERGTKGRERERKTEKVRKREGGRERGKTVFSTSVPKDWYSSNSSERYP